MLSHKLPFLYLVRTNVTTYFDERVKLFSVYNAFEEKEYKTTLRKLLCPSLSLES